MLVLLSNKASSARRGIIISLFWLFCAVFSFEAGAQNIYYPKVKRILFLLDASGSMKEDFGGKSKYQLAKALLYHIADSIGRMNRNVQFGLRMFGHQSPKSAHDCKDSKLEIPFSSNNAYLFRQVMEKATPQGWTPIAYSIFLAANDFPSDPNALNAIILITDGLENCDGDPCATAILLQKKRISLKPFIVGLGIGQQKGEDYFDCVGTYYDATDQQSFENVVNVVVSQALNTTTAQVNLMDVYNQPTETDVEMTFYDNYSGAIRYNFVHTMNSQGLPDTLYIDPVGKYDLTVHSIPSVTVSGIELVPGKHNIIPVDVPQGNLKLKIEGSVGFSNIQCVIRPSEEKDILYVQDFNTEQKYLIGNYDLEILTLPRIYRSMKINQSKTTEIQVPKAGSLVITASQPYIAGIYSNHEGRLERVYEFKKMGKRETLDIQPGTYTVIYRPLDAKEAVLTQTKVIIVEPSKIAKLNL